MKKSFEDWFNGVEPEQAPKEKPPEKFYDYDAELPLGVDFSDTPGRYRYQCRSCENWYEMDWELEEDSYESHYCGRDQWCCPLNPPDNWLKHKKVVTNTVPQAKPKRGQPVLPTSGRLPPPANPDLSWIIWAEGGKARFDREVRDYGAQWAAEVHTRREYLRRDQLGLSTKVPAPPTKKAEPTFRCTGCGNYYPTAQRRIIGGKAFCSSYGCVNEQVPAKRYPTPAEVQARHEMQKAMRAPEFDPYNRVFVCPGCNVRIPECHAQRHPHTSLPYCGGNECYDRLKLMAYQGAYIPPRAG